MARGSTVTGPFATIAEPADTTYEDRTVTNGTTYYYVVRAVSAVGSSGSSSATSATPERVLLPQTLTFDQPAGRVYGAPDGPLVAQATSGLPVAFTSLSTAVCTVSGSTLHVVAAGTCSVEATQAGDGDRAPADPAVRELTVAKAPLVVTASNATMRRRGLAPAVSPTYTGFVLGETVGAISGRGSCVAVVATRTTSCGGVTAANYEPTYRGGRIATVSRRGYAVISAPSAYWAAGLPVTLPVVVDGGRTRLSWSGDLPAGVRAVAQNGRKKLAFTGTPRTPGVSTLDVVAQMKVRRAKRARWRTVATQTVTLRVY